MERKRGISCSDPCKEVGLPGLDGSFCSVATVLVRRDTLEIDIVVKKCFFEIAGTFVV